MKKLLVGIIALVLGVVGMPTTARALDTNNFTISSYDVQMTLGRDGDNRSTLSAKETIVAAFPDFDQNHGLERAFVKTYDGHDLSFNLTNVTDANGNALNYHWNGDNLRIGDGETYVHGLQTYVIAYTMRDVTRYYSDTGRDEFYWDVIGTDWQVPIASATVQLALDPALQAALTGNTACYQGASGSTATCQVQKTDNGFAVTAQNLQPGEGVTMAIGFNKGTFAAYQRSVVETLVALWIISQFILPLIAVVVVICCSVRWYRRLNRTKELGTIVPEYLPPKDVSVTTAARIAGPTASAMTAQLLDLAVRHYVKIYEVKEKTLFSPAEYEIEVIRDVSDLREEEQELLKDTFGNHPQVNLKELRKEELELLQNDFGILPAVGQRINLKELRNNPAYYKRTLNNKTDLDKLIQGKYGLRESDAGMKNWARRAMLINGSLAVLMLSITWFFVAAVFYFMSTMPWRLTDKGLELKRYLEGLKMYISVAETERIQMLQSPEGAEKVRDVTSGTDSASLIKLYEKVLPYAVLFGQEKEWNKQLGRYYEAANASPDWYAGQNAVFNAAVFSSAMSSFSQANSYASSSSSGSGGSGGGGFSGGGGGGGGGGGW